MLDMSLMRQDPKFRIELNDNVILEPFDTSEKICITPGCHKTIAHGNKSGLCKQCAHRARKSRFRLERQSKLLNLLRKGVEMPEIVKRLSKAYNVSPSTIYKDRRLVRNQEHAS